MSIAIPFHDHILHLQPSKVIAVGLNYKDHIQESLSVKVRGFDTEEPEEPVLFAKLPSCIIGNGDTIQLPSIVKKYNFHSTRTDYEGELAVVLGKTGKDIHPAEALDYVMGITCANDVSQRNVQNMDKSGWFRGKSFDTFLPLGPRIVPVSQCADIQNLCIRTMLNGNLVQESNTCNMIFPITDIVSFVSRNFTLCPHDVILTGTPSGVGPIVHGDTVTVEIENIGVLQNTVVGTESV